MVASAGGRFVRSSYPECANTANTEGTGPWKSRRQASRSWENTSTAWVSVGGFGLVLAVGVSVLTLGTLAPAILLVYPVVEYLWLAKGDQLVTFDRVKAYNAIPEKQLIAIQFVGTPWETPVVLRTPDWQAIYDALWAHVPRALFRDPTHLS